MKVFELIAPTLLALISSGCATNLATKVGERTERVAFYEAAYQSGDLVFLRYSAQIWPEPANSRFSANLETRWAVGSLSSLKWVPLAALGQASRGKFEAERNRPSTTSDVATEVSLHRYPFMPTQDMIEAIKRDHSEPLSAHVSGEASVIFLRNDPNSKTGLVVARASLPEIQHVDENWAPYARVALVPIALVADILTAPIQAIAFLIVVLGQRH